MSDKCFKTIDEQIAVLCSRGLKIEDEANAKSFLTVIYCDGSLESFSNKFNETDTE